VSWTRKDSNQIKKTVLEVVIPSALIRASESLVINFAITYPTAVNRRSELHCLACGL
jgi:hypothetical protein